MHVTDQKQLTPQDSINLLVSSVVDYAIITLDLDGEIITWNEGAQRIKGYLAKEIIGQKFSCFYTQEDRDAGKPQRELEVAKAKGRFEDFGWRVRKDGSKFFANVVITAFRDEAGRLVGFGKVTRDITERVKAEAELKEQSELLELTHDTIMVRDLDGTIRFWNKGAEEMYGFTREEAIGRKSHDLLQTEFSKPLAEIEEETIRTGRWGGELMHKTRDQRSVIVSSRWALKLDASAKPIGFLEINNDITQQKLAEQVIRHANEELEVRVEERTRELFMSEELLRTKVLELERSNGELQQFGYVCSHDLQEPLRTISNYTQLLALRYRGRRLDDEAFEFIGFVVDASKRMRDLINDLLRYSRIETKGEEFKDTDCSLAVEMAIANLQVAIEENMARIECEPLPIVRGEGLQLLQLFQNLISNAIKFRSKESPQIQISAEDSGDFWKITVRDNGLGFAMQQVERIFVIFQRLHAREDYPGSGIGLAICKKIVERHGGQIWVKSAPGVGSSFYFTLPKQQSRESTNEPPN